MTAEQHSERANPSATYPCLQRAILYSHNAWCNSSSERGLTLISATTMECMTDTSIGTCDEALRRDKNDRDLTWRLCMGDRWHTTVKRLALQ